MVLRDVVDGHLPRIEPHRGRTVVELEKMYYERLERFRKAIEPLKYEIHEEIPELADVVRTELPESIGKGINISPEESSPHAALSAVLRSITRDYFLKKAHEDPEKRKIVAQVFESQMGPTERLAVLREKLGEKETLRTLTAISRAGSRLEVHLKGMRHQGGMDDATGRVVERISNVMTSYYSGSQNLIQRMVERK